MRKKPKHQSSQTRPVSVPAPAVRRLSLYLRCLDNLCRDDRGTVSSRQLGDALKLTDAQVRKDLACFGQFGQPGIGYQVDELIKRIREILGTDRMWNVLLVGAGHLGMALSAHRGFARRGFRLVAVFDNDRAKIGKPIPNVRDVRIQPIEEVDQTVRDRDIRLAIIAVPAEAAQDIAQRLVSAGVRGLLNFAPVSLDVDTQVPVTAVDLAVHLEQLSFQVGANTSMRDAAG